MSGQDARTILGEARRLAAGQPAEAYAALSRLRAGSVTPADRLVAGQLLASMPLAVRQGPAFTTSRLAFAGNCNLRYTAAAAAWQLAPRIAAEVYESPFDAWAAELQVAGSGLEQFSPDVLVLQFSSLGLTTGGTRLADPPVAEVDASIRSFAARCQARVIVVLPEPLPEGTGGITAADRWYTAARDAFTAMVQSLAGDGLPVVALDPVPALLAAQAEWRGARYWAQGKIPMHPTACAVVGERAGRMVEALVAPRIKAIAVDCDNTLWGGEVGDVGAAGVNLSAFDTGAGYLRLQRLLKEAVERGLLLIALSKNEDAAVRAVFAERSEMLLSLEDFSAIKVNWEPKAGNLRSAIEELNIGLDAVMFLDDSPFEREQMRALCPQVFVPELPRDADEYAAAVAALGALERPFVTAEDLRRRELYVEERRREAARRPDMTAEDFLRSLELRLIAHPVGADNLTRVVQLLAKTNQFNLTSRRHPAERVAAFAADPASYAYCFQLLDRFGDAGIVGVVLAQADGDAAAIDTLLMSCRVLGRTAERGMIEHLRQWAASRGLSTMVGEYRPTARNAPVSRLLPDTGFELTGSTDEAQRYARPVASCPVGGVFVSLVEAAARGSELHA